MEIIASRFEGPGRVGDFAWMIEQPGAADALFVFNDNEEQFRAFRRDPFGGAGCARGGGNASIRPYRCLDPPRAAGVPTGRAGHGYQQLTTEVRAVVDEALAVIDELVASGRYARLYYSAGTDDGDLGTGIFEVGEDVRRHVVTHLRALGG